MNVNFSWSSNIGVHMKISLRCSSSFPYAQYVLFISLGWFMRWGVSGHTINSRICSKIAFSILVEFPSNFLSMDLVKLQVQPYSSTDTATVWKNSSFILSERSDFHVVIDLSIVVHVLSVCMLIWPWYKYTCFINSKLRYKFFWLMKKVLWIIFV